MPCRGVLILRGALSGNGGSDVGAVGGRKLGEGDCVGEEYAWGPPLTKPFCNEGFKVSNIGAESWFMMTSYVHVSACWWDVN